MVKDLKFSILQLMWSSFEGNLTSSVPKMHIFSNLSVLLLEPVLKSHMSNDVDVRYSLHPLYWQKIEVKRVKRVVIHTCNGILCTGLKRTRPVSLYSCME